MSKFSRAVSIILIPVIILFVIYLPQYADKELGRNLFHEWQTPKREPYTGKIKIWHIAAFRPYVGSLGSFLKEAAKAVNKRYFGVIIEVEAITPEEAAERLECGDKPDAFSFPAGFIEPEDLRPFGEELREAVTERVDTSLGLSGNVLYAVPYCASCSFILYYPEFVDAEKALKTENVDEEAFKKQKESALIADAGVTGRLCSSALSGKMEHFEVLAFDKGTNLSQFFGISAECDDIKVRYIEEFFKTCTAEKRQEKLCELGLLPLNAEVDLKFEYIYLDEAYELIRRNKYGVAPAF